MAFDVFISYAHDDKPVADAACALLEKSDIRCWIAPRDISPGVDYATALMEALDSCKALVLIFSGCANESPHIRREVERAVSRGVPLIPVRIENIEPTAALRYFVGSVHWLDALTPPIEEHLGNLAMTLGAILKQPTQDVRRQGVPRQDAPRQNAPRQNAPRQNAPRQSIAPAPVPLPNDANMKSRLFRAQIAGIGCFACSGLNMLLLVAIRDTIDLLLSIVGAGFFYALVFRNLTGDLIMARNVLALCTAVLAVYWLNAMLQGLWAFAVTDGLNLLFGVWMIYEVFALLRPRKA
jgi:hypothetical protein